MPLLEIANPPVVDPAVHSGPRPAILVLMDYYLPGYKSGGPLHAISGLVEALGNEFQFRIITSDRDLGDRKPYPGIERNRWTRLGKTALLYIDRRNPFAVIRNARKTPHDVLYMKSFFSVPFSIWPVWMHALGILRSGRIVLAPCGEFAVGALALGIRRKRIYIALVNWLGLYKRVIWHATSEYEAEDVKRAFGSGSQTVTARSIAAGGPSAQTGEEGIRVVIASELGQLEAATRADGVRPAKEPGELRVIFISRVARNKNLEGALESLRHLRGEVVFDIFGPREDGRYWEECQKIVDTLPSNIRVRYRGSVPHNQVSGVLQDYHLFYLPTQGENFSYSILEALLAGVPILISDKTPWRDLEAAGVGWDVPLDRPEGFREVLQQCIDMGPEEHRGMTTRATAFGKRHGQDPEVVARNRALFQTALSESFH